MTEASSVLRLGDWIVYDNEENQVVGFAGSCVRLRSAEGRAQVVLLGELLVSEGFQRRDDPRPLDDLQNGKEDRAALLECLPQRERTRVEQVERRLLRLMGLDAPASQSAKSTGTIPVARNPRDLDHRIGAAAIEAGLSKRQMWREYTAYVTYGLWGIVDKRTVRLFNPLANLDHRVADAILIQHAVEIDDSTGSVQRFMERVRRRLEIEYEGQVIPLPSERTLRRQVGLLLAGKHTFGAATTRRTTANQPAGLHGRVQATRAGQVVMLDTTRLDVLAYDARTDTTVSLELTIALDVATRSILAWRITPVGTNRVDAVMLIADMMTPLMMRPGWDDRLRYAYLGVFTERLMTLDERYQAAASLPVIRPETLIVDHGKIYVSDAMKAACRLYGISLQPGRLGKPTDKPHVETAFNAVGQSFSQHVAGFKSPNVANRGHDVEGVARWSLDEIEEFFAEWVVAIYQRRAHTGLRLPATPYMRLSPNDAYAAAIAIAGYVPCPADPNRYLELLPVHWCVIHPYGVNYDRLVYADTALTKYKNFRSPYPGHGGKWPIRVDPRNRLHVYFKDPEHGTWHVVRWAAADDRMAPFTDRTLKYVMAELAGRGISNPRGNDVADALRDLHSRTDAAESVTARDRRALARERARTRQVARDQAPADVVEGTSADPDGGEVSDGAPSLFDIDDVPVFGVYGDQYEDADESGELSSHDDGLLP